MAKGLLGLGGAGKFGGNSQERNQEKMLGLAVGSLIKGRGFMGERLDEAQGYLTRLPGIFNRSFNQAERELDLSGSLAKTEILGREQQYMATEAQRIANAGLSNTSLQTQANAFITGDTSRQIARMRNEMGQVRANLALQRGQALSGAYTNLGNFLMQRAGQEVDLQKAISGVYQNVQYQGGADPLSSLLSTGISMLPFFMGPGGAAAGAAAGAATGGYQYGSYLN